MKPYRRKNGGGNREKYGAGVIVLGCIVLALFFGLSGTLIVGFLSSGKAGGDTAPPLESVESNPAELSAAQTETADGNEQQPSEANGASPDSAEDADKPENISESSDITDNTSGNSSEGEDGARQSAEVSESVSGSPESPPSADPTEKKGEIIDLEAGALAANAGSVYYGVYYFGSGDYCDSGNSEKTPSASVIKVFIMEYAFIKQANGELSLDETAGGTPLLSLITGMIRISDNNATNTLIDYFGMDELNAFFAESGYADTVLERKMLDEGARASGLENYTSLNDSMAFLKKLYDRREEDPYKQMLEIMSGQQIRTKIPLKLPYDIEVANKTGELNDVENDIGLVFAADSPFAVAVLTNEVYDTAAVRNAIADFALIAFERIIYTDEQNE